MFDFSNESAMSKVEKSTMKYFCEKCDYNTLKKTDFNKHLLTEKHNRNVLAINSIEKSNENESNKKFSCEKCNKNYCDYSGLWRHKKKCIHVISNDKEISDRELILMLVKQNADLAKDNSEFKNLMMEVIKNGTHNNTETHTNSHNKSFNLQFFLNETCKNAMNITDFVDSIKLQLSDLENVGEVGYVKGITNIIVKNLKALDVTKRPVHCTDSKREVIYVKDDNKWEKDTDDKIMMKKLVKKISNKNIGLIPDFKAKYPDCIYSESKKSDQYNKLIVEAFELGDGEKQEKIIKNVVKEVVIDKTNSA